MVGVPVKIEHRGVDVGRVVSAWIHEASFALLSPAFREILLIVKS